MSELVARGLAGVGVLLILIGMWAIYKLILSAFDPGPDGGGDEPEPVPEPRPLQVRPPPPVPALPAAPPAESRPEPAERERLVLLVARHDKVIQSPIAGVYINLGKCFGDLGFLVQRSASLSELEARLEAGVPAVMGVDLRLGPRTLQELARLARRFPALRDSVLLFYNAEHPEALAPPAILPHAHFLGLAFASQQVMEILAPAFEFEPVSAEPVSGEPHQATGATGAIFEGTLSENSLPEILQFLEVGKRTGLLSLETEQPVGVVNFEEGEITSAQTHTREGAEAVFEMLGLNRGKFRFFPGRATHQGGQRLSATLVLMQWAQRLDETGEMAVRGGKEDFRFDS